MRYYDIQTTPKDGKTFSSDGINRIIQSDEKVKNWFEPLLKGYKRAYTEDGLPFNELIPPPPSPTQEELKEIFIQNRTIIMDSIGWIHERVQSQYVLVQGGDILSENYNATQKLEYYRYKQLLRTLPASITDWNNITYPTPAQFLYDDMRSDIQELLIELGCSPV